MLTALIIPVIQLEAHFTRAGEAIAATGGQTMARWLVLEMVAGKPATVADVARRLGLTRQSVQRVADLLEHDALTEYVHNPAHERSQLIRITLRGRRTLEKIQSAQRVWADSVGAAIGEAELRNAGAVVDRLTHVLVRHNQGSRAPRVMRSAG